MVFEVMGPNILDLIKQHNYRGVPIDQVRVVAANALMGLDYLHRVCNIIHTDFKPENMLVCCPNGHPVNKNGESLIPHVSAVEPPQPELKKADGPLTKNQKKKLKKKLKKNAARAQPEAEPTEPTEPEGPAVEVVQTKLDGLSM